MVVPGTFILEPFCPVIDVNRAAGLPPKKVAVLPIKNFVGPMIPPEIIPPATPGWSPLLIGISVPTVWAGPPEINTFMAPVDGLAVAPIEIFGYGSGTTAGPTGVLHTSGMPMF